MLCVSKYFMLLIKKILYQYALEGKREHVQTAEKGFLNDPSHTHQIPDKGALHLPIVPFNWMWIWLRSSSILV